MDHLVYDHLLATLWDLIKEAIFLFEKQDEKWQERTGAWFCVADARTGVPLFDPSLIGQVPLEKAEKYFRFCVEKAIRLANHPEHESSWESRNPDAGEWGGAVRVGDYIFSISGYPEMGDEALMLILAEVHSREDQAVIETVTRIASRSNNPYWQRLRGFLGRLA